MVMDQWLTSTRLRDTLVRSKLQAPKVQKKESRKLKRKTGKLGRLVNIELKAMYLTKRWIQIYSYPMAIVTE